MWTLIFHLARLWINLENNVALLKKILRMGIFHRSSLDFN